MAPRNARPTIAVLLPPVERDPVVAELRNGGFDPVVVNDPRELEALVAAGGDVTVAVLDVDGEGDGGTSTWSLLHRYGRDIPALLVVDPVALGRLDTGSQGHDNDEYLTRPYSAESIRWRIEAMCIRSMAVDDGTGPVLQSTLDHGDWARRGQMIAVFNPKGGVGKTMIATNLAAALTARGRSVLLVDADTVTGHVPISLGMDGVRTVVDAWRDEADGGPVLSFDEQATLHASGLKVLPLAANPIDTGILDADRVAASLDGARRAVDFVIVDLHPGYGSLNRAVLDASDRVLVPVTPDLPAIRAAMKLRDVADEVGLRNRLSLIVNRANSGVSVTDVERALDLPAYGQIRSGGLLLVRAANEGRTLIEIAPREKITADFETLADRLLGITERQPSRVALNLFGRRAVAHV